LNPKLVEGLPHFWGRAEKFGPPKSLSLNVQRGRGEICGLLVIRTDPRKTKTIQVDAGCAFRRVGEMKSWQQAGFGRGKMERRTSRVSSEDRTGTRFLHAAKTLDFMVGSSTFRGVRKRRINERIELVKIGHARNES